MICLLLPSLSIALKVVLNPHLIGSANGTSITVELTERSEYTGTNTPLAGGCTAPRIARPAFQSRLNQITGTVGHAWPQEKLSILGSRGRTGDDRGHGIDNGGLRGTERHTSTPAISLDVCGASIEQASASKASTGKERRNDLHSGGIFFHNEGIKNEDDLLQW
jgi:hypothetical protein